MAESRNGSETAGVAEPGAPIAPDHIDPELIKLSRTRLRIGVITAAGLVLLGVLFLLRLGPDRRFASSSAEATQASVADVVAGKVDRDQLVRITAEPLVSRAIRATKAAGSLGFRLVPLRGSDDRLWLVVSGDGWEAPATSGYVGRLRKLDELPFADATHTYAAEHPRPVFATVAAVRAGFASGSVTTASGDRVALTDHDAVALDAVAPAPAIVAPACNTRPPDTAAWLAALGRAGITPTSTGTPDAALGQVRFQVPASIATVTAALEKAGLLAARVEPVTRHHETTWAALRASPTSGLVFAGTTLPDVQIDL